MPDQTIATTRRREPGCSTGARRSSWWHDWNRSASDPTTPPPVSDLGGQTEWARTRRRRRAGARGTTAYQVRGCGGRERCRGVRLGRRSCCELHRCSDEYPWLQHRHAAGNRDERRLHHAPRGQPTYGCRQLITVISRTESGGASKSQPKLAERVAGAGRHGGGGAFVVHVTLGLSWRRQNRCSGCCMMGFAPTKDLFPCASQPVSALATRRSPSNLRHGPLRPRKRNYWLAFRGQQRLKIGYRGRYRGLRRPGGVPGRFCKNT